MLREHESPVRERTPAGQQHDERCARAGNQRKHTSHQTPQSRRPPTMHSSECSKSIIHPIVPHVNKKGIPNRGNAAHRPTLPPGRAWHAKTQWPVDYAPARVKLRVKQQDQHKPTPAGATGALQVANTLQSAMHDRIHRKKGTMPVGAMSGKLDHQGPRSRPSSHAVQRYST